MFSMDVVGIGNLMFSEQSRKIESNEFCVNERLARCGDRYEHLNIVIEDPRSIVEKVVYQNAPRMFILLYGIAVPLVDICVYVRHNKSMRYVR